MGIGKISDYGSMIQSYRVSSIPVVSVEEAMASQAGQVENGRGTDTPALQQQQEQVVRQAAPEVNLQDVSMSLKTGDFFEMTGRDSDIEQLDIQKAISDMKKDSILEQYQFFVGTAQNVLQNNIEPDGIVIAKL